jgi:hypothetical protein
LEQLGILACGFLNLGVDRRHAFCGSGYVERKKTI